ncbi:MAG: beta-N-acetylhexosaminidase [Candidatus Aminicenantaceae bacterium]
MRSSTDDPGITLMPFPEKISFGQGKLAVNSEFHVALSGYQEPRLKRAILRLIQRLNTQTGLLLPCEIEKNISEAILEINCQGPGEEMQSLNEDESYTLEITSSRAYLQAPTPVGVLRGIETFLQLVKLGSEGFYIPAVKIQDRPRFPWRGLLIDVCRHWMPIEVIKRNLDAMAAVKLNVLHWHLTEDQGFRIECKKFPKLHEEGSDGKYFTQDQVRQILGFARDRGIRVVPEFDMPGHTTSWFIGHPELASAPGPYQIERHWGIHDPCMNPAREEVYTFLDSFFEEMTELFPDEYLHIGGDEVNGIHWNNNPDIVAFKQKNKMKENHDLQVYFNKRIQAILSRHGKKMVGWDEILHRDLPKNIVVQSWRGQKSLARAASDGYLGILSCGYYLDHILPASFHYKVDPLDKEAAVLSAEQKTRILGGEACMWGEFVTPETIDSRIWPRAACIAERLWSPQDSKDIADMYRRLDVLSQHFDLLGLTHRSGYPKMLKRLAGKHPIDSLKTLADIVEPVKFYTRPSTHEYTQMTPLNRLVDASRPESNKARQFRKMVDEILVDLSAYKHHKETIREWLTKWHTNHDLLIPILEKSFLLKEIVPLSKDVASIANLGLEALSYIESNKQPPQSWLEKSFALLYRPQKPEYELKIMIVTAIRKLVETAYPPLFSDDFEDGKAHGWKPSIPEHWSVAEEEGTLAYQLISPGSGGEVRAPASWSVLKDFDVTSFVFTGRAKCKADATNKHRDVVVIFHYQDPTHFYYVHFSAVSDDVHNIIGLVNGKDRVKINHEPSGQSMARMNDLRFHDFKVTCDVETGDIKVYMDDMANPILTATDKTLRHGFVGVGSYDDTGSFDDIKLWGEVLK